MEPANVAVALLPTPLGRTKKRKPSLRFSFFTRGAANRT